MAEHELERRLRTAARELDAHAPAFDRALLRGSPWRGFGGALVLVCVVAVAGLVAAPAAVSALHDLFDVDEVPALGPLEPSVAPPYAGRSVPASTLQAATPFRVRTMSSLGQPDEARVRDDIRGGMVTLVYREGQLLLTQWRTTDVHQRVALVPLAGGEAEDMYLGALPALWIEGTARGTFTLVGADGAIHGESFAVSSGALLWRADELTFLLQGAESKTDAIGLATDVR